MKTSLLSMVHVHLAKSEQSLRNCIGPDAASSFYKEFSQKESLINLFSKFPFVYEPGGQAKRGFSQQFLDQKFVL
ncbi:hypothetical protein, partial [Escherichia coli]|uniref:hypothetical protein n=1 Tax=Escherichia coli TaxID=562 RepID=UPI003B9CE673